MRGGGKVWPMSLPECFTLLSLGWVVEGTLTRDPIVVLDGFNTKLVDDIMTWKEVTGRNGCPDLNLGVVQL